MKHEFIQSLTPSHAKGMAQQIEELQLANSNLEGQLSAARSTIASLEAQVETAKRGLKSLMDQSREEGWLDIFNQSFSIIAAIERDRERGLNGS